jgi:integrase/recombinase XerD
MATHTPLSLDEALEAYRQHLARRPLSDNTRKAFLGDARIFARFVSPDSPDAEDGARGAPSLPITRLRAEHIREFLADQERGSVANSPKSIERRLTSLKVFFKWLRDAGHIALDPAEGVAYAPFQDALPEALTEPEAAAVAAAARALAASDKQELRPLTAILLVLDTGIKKGECLALTVDDVALEPPAGPSVAIRYARKHLQFKDRRLPISDETAQAVRDHIARYESRAALFACTGRNLEYLFNRRVAPAAGIQALTFEMLRWTCAVRDFVSGALSDEQMQIRYGLSPIGWSEMQAKLARLTRQGVPDPAQTR